MKARQRIDVITIARCAPRRIHEAPAMSRPPLSLSDDELNQIMAAADLSRLRINCWMSRGFIGHFAA
jgi:hypothetical protein